MDVSFVVASSVDSCEKDKKQAEVVALGPKILPMLVDCWRSSFYLHVLILLVVVEAPIVELSAMAVTFGSFDLASFHVPFQDMHGS